ncbi:MAG TPA: ABC transporter substrate-binding protein [Clostridia bacterium]|nr:ABC transporter substrate-binding protein [Clostridia bacterium]
MKRMIKILILSVVLLSILTGCSTNTVALKREKEAGQGDEILIGVPVPLEFAQKNTKFLKGIELALEDLNAKGVNGKKIKLEIADDQGNFKTAVDLAQEFSKNTRMVAVIGHWFSDICLPVSSIYEEAGMLTIVPTVSNPDLTGNGYKYVFQNIISDKRIAEKMCSYAKSQGYERVVVCYEDSSYGRNLTAVIEREAKEKGIRIVDRCSGLVTEEQFKRAYDKWKALEFDAVLLALNMPEGGNYIKELRKVNKEVGIIAADGLDVGNFIELLGEDAEGVVIVTTYNPYRQASELDKFTQRYRDKYNEEPDVWAIQGYESLQLIAHAIEQTDSYSPAVLADYLRNMDPMRSVLGEISFNNYGEVEGKEVYGKIVTDGQFNYID